MMFEPKQLSISQRSRVMQNWLQANCLGFIETLQIWTHWTSASGHLWLAIDNRRSSWNGITSSLHSVVCGVPRGSVRGPLHCGCDVDCTKTPRRCSLSRWRRANYPAPDVGRSAPALHH